MSVRVDDFQCDNCQTVKEDVFYNTDDDLEQFMFCDKCDKIMHKCFPAPKGYVKDTTNPVRYR